MAGMIFLFIVAGILVLLFGGAMVSTYNSLVQVRNNIDKAWANIDVLLLQRHDELPKIIDAVKGYMKHEAGLIERVTKLRVGYEQAGPVDEKIKIENELNREMLRLRHAWEGYPDLKSSQNFLQLQERISGLESQIADRREFFNDSINIYNIQIEKFPDALLAKLLGYQRRPFLEVPEEKKQDVKITL